MPFPRSCGILLHPTSLPSPYGIGDLGEAARQFVDFLYDSGQQIWQVLPLGPTGHGNSPYMSYSSMAGNPILISLDQLTIEGWLYSDELGNLRDFPADWVDYNRVNATHMALLKTAAQRFRDGATIEQRQEYKDFCVSKAFWLDDYALFMALKEQFGGKSWYQWEGAIARRQPDALEHWRTQLRVEIEDQKFLQFEFHRQWADVKAYANEAGIQIMGDIPIYVAHDSADVWAFPDFFHLDPETGEPALMAGVPPDYFSATGQLWGNPIYRWDRLQNDGFSWWIERFSATLELVDMVRIDHFRGFSGYWAVTQGEETALNGEWLDAPGDAFFQKLGEQLGSLPIIAEDLGVITPDVAALRDKYHLPGMKILHFAFDGGSGNPFLPFNYDRNFVVYTGTHDNDTTQGWYQSLNDGERQNVLDYMGCTSSDGIHWDFIRLAMSSVANQAVFPLQDAFGLGSDARMNYPGKGEGNWGWRYRSDYLGQELRDRLHKFTGIYGRLPTEPAPRKQREEEEAKAIENNHE
ncbi:MAG: 4-alpha-glucanotransferase [Cyanobacteria bacterium J06638_22]